MRAEGQITSQIILSTVSLDSRPFCHVRIGPIAHLASVSTTGQLDKAGRLWPYKTETHTRTALPVGALRDTTSTKTLCLGDLPAAASVGASRPSWWDFRARAKPERVKGSAAPPLRRPKGGAIFCGAGGCQTKPAHPIG